MSDYLINFVLCFFIFWVGYRIGKIHAILKIAKEVADQINAQSGGEVLIHVEKHQDHYFLYNGEHKFLAQGTSFVEMMTNLKARFPGQDFKINKDQDNLSEEEMGQLVKAIFEVFGERKSVEEQA